MRREHEPPAQAQTDAPDESAETGERLVELVLAEHAERAAEPPPPRRIHGVVIGRFTGLGPKREALVDFPGNASEAPIAARSTVPVAAADQGRAVALMFEEGDPARPLLLGLIHEPEAPATEQIEVEPEAGTEAGSAPPQELQVEADGERVVVSAEKELVLRCGKASITLTQAGKILIRGAYVLTRSSGVNRIQGGSVQIN